MAGNDALLQHLFAISAEIERLKAAHAQPRTKAADGLTQPGLGDPTSGPNSNYTAGAGQSGPLSSPLGATLDTEETANYTPQSQFTATGLGFTGGNQGSLSDYSGAINNSQDMYNATYGNQQQLVGQLQQQAQGNGPAQALANQQMLQALQQGQGQAAGTIASQRGLNPALAVTGALNTQAAQAGQAAGQATQERLESQLGATSALGGVLGQQQQGNLGLLGTAVNGQNAQNQALLNQNLGVQGLNQNTALGNAQIGQNAINTKVNAATGTAGETGQLLGGIINGVASTTSSALGGGGGGITSMFADGGDVNRALRQIPAGHGPHPGDDKRNDTIPLDVQRGERVLPASIADDPKAGAAFIAEMNKRANVKPNMAAALQELHLLTAKVSALQAKLGVRA